MRLFLDSSAFVKRYVDEPGTDRVISLCTAADALALSTIVIPEVISTLRRLVRESRLDDVTYTRLKAAVVGDVADAEVCDLTATVLGRTVACLERNPLRAMDAIHVASALVYGADLFVSADRRQVAAARGEGLTVEDLGD